MRAVVSGRGHATEKMAELAEHQLNEHVESQDSYVRDTSDFLTKLQGVEQPVVGREGHKPLVFCMDVTKLYPSVPRTEGVAACREALEARTAANIPTEELVEVIQLVLGNNNFQLGDSRNYIQTDGTAIGSKLGRNFACTYMGVWEKELLSRTAFRPHKQGRRIRGAVGAAAPAGKIKRGKNYIFAPPPIIRSRKIYILCHKIYNN